MNISKLKLLAIILVTVFASVEGTLLGIGYVDQHTLYCNRFPLYLTAIHKDGQFFSADYVSGFYVGKGLNASTVYHTFQVDYEGYLPSIKPTLYYGNLYLNGTSNTVHFFDNVPPFYMTNGDSIGGLWFRDETGSYYVFVCA